MPGFDLIRGGTQLHSGKVAGALSKTVPGMAHFADMSSSKHCGQCRFFAFDKNKPKGKQICTKCKEMMGKAYRVAKIGPKQRACKHFEPRQGA